MKSLARYGVANAVTRTMLSELLTREDFDAIIVHGAKKIVETLIRFKFVLEDIVYFLIKKITLFFPF